MTLAWCGHSQGMEWPRDGNGLRGQGRSLDQPVPGHGRLSSNDVHTGDYPEKSYQQNYRLEDVRHGGRYGERERLIEEKRCLWIITKARMTWSKNSLDAVQRLEIFPSPRIVGNLWSASPVVYRLTQVLYHHPPPSPLNVARGCIFLTNNVCKLTNVLVPSLGSKSTPGNYYHNQWGED